MTANPDDEGFMTRWSRRKLQPDEPDGADEVDAGTPSEGEAVDEAEAQALAEAEALCEADVDRLTPESDFTIYMRKGVAPNIKRMALRKLWTSSPVLANLDGLNDYDGDFTDAATSMKNFTSSWTAGKGYLFKEDPNAQAALSGEPAAPGEADGTEPDEEGAIEVCNDGDAASDGPEEHDAATTKV